MNQKSKSVSWVGLSAGVLAIFLLQQVSFIITPAVQSLSEYYPDVPYSSILMLQTAVYLMIIPFSFISGAITGTKVSYRFMAITATILIGLGGLIPYFVHENFTLVFASRFLCGIGEGLAFPLGSALIIDYFRGERRNFLQGISMFVVCLSGVVYQNVSGILCVSNVNNIWLLHIGMIIPLIIIIIWLKEPASLTAEQRIQVAEKGGAAKAEMAEKTGEMLPDNSGKPKYHWRASGINIAFGFLFIPLYGMLLNMSPLMAQREIGDAATAGLVGSFYTIGGLVSGICFPFLYKALKRWLVPIMLGAGIIGNLVIWLGQNTAMMCIGELCIGLCAFLIWPASMRDFDVMVNQKGVLFYSGLWGALWNLGATLSTYWISGFYKFIGAEDAGACAGASLVFTIVVAVIWFIVRLRRPADLHPEYK